MPTLLESLRTHLWLLPHLVTFLLLGLLGGRLIANIRFLRSMEPHAPTNSATMPRVSVLIPARNEAATIVSCVTSLARQRFPNVELHVLDDRSTDGTSQQLEALQAHYPHLAVIYSTEEPPPGWNGKSYACHRLAERATGDWLLFTDADTQHTPNSIALGVSHATTLNTALLSAFPSQRTETWSERVLVSFILDFIPLTTVSLTSLGRGTGNRTIANGQYLLVRADSYRATGGHASVHQALVDDFALAARFRACGYRIAMVNGTTLLSCRMYSSFRAVWDGFSKNALIALSASSLHGDANQESHWQTHWQTHWPLLWQAPLFAWCYASLFVIPWFNLAFTSHRHLAVLEIGGILLVRGLAAWYLKRPVVEILLTPLASWFLLALGLTSLYRRWRRRPITWKGRQYSI